MKSITIITALVLLAGVAVGQSPATQAPAAAPAPNAAAMNSPVPDGTVIRVELKNDIDTKKAKVGDPVKLEAVEDSKSKDGKVIVPRKTQLMGTVTESDASTKASPDAKLAFLVTSLTFPSGQKAPVTAILVGKIKPLAALTGSTSIAKANEAEGAGNEFGALNLGLIGVTLKQDQKLGSVLVADKKNIILDRGTQFDIRQVMPQAPGAAEAAPATQPTPSSK